MTINIKNIINIVAKKITTADSSESFDSLSSYLNIAQRQGLGTVREDSGPSLAFGFDDQSRLRYDGESLYVRKNAGWNKRLVIQEFYQGQISGYVSGGRTNVTPGSTSAPKTLTQFSLLTGNTVTGYQDLLFNGAPQPGPGGNWPNEMMVGLPNHSTAGYTAGGYRFSPGPSSERSSRVNKFPFANPESYSSGILSMTISVGDAASASDGTKGYVMHGRTTFPTILYTNNIVAFSFASETPAPEGNISTSDNLTKCSGHTSATDGYRAGGVENPFVLRNTVNKFPFASPPNFVSAIPAGLTNATNAKAAISSFDNGYIIGSTPSATSSAQRYPFSSTTFGAVFPYDLNVYTEATGISGENEGFYVGGQVVSTNPAESPFPNPGTNSEYIQKFPYANETVVTHALLPQANDPSVNNINGAAGNQR